MMDLPPAVQHKLKCFGQSHVLSGWDALTPAEQEALVQQLAALDLVQIAQLFEKSRELTTPPSLDRIAPIPTVAADHEAALAACEGAGALARGEVAALVVAGGQGTRLRCDQPKGLFEIGPVSNRTLVQIHAEHVLARTRRHGGRIPFLVMTSPATDAETKAYFRDRGNFGLPAADVSFFCQGTMPALDAATGQLLLAAPGRLALSPNGHGGTLMALHQNGLLDALVRQGVRYVYYFQVDNPLAKIADPVFLGQHIRARSEVSSKVVPKRSPTDKVGNFVLLDGRCTIIEYSDLPLALAEARNSDGELRIRAGNPALHIFDVAFLQRLAHEEAALPYHSARKRVKYWDGTRLVEPNSDNALKFEKFIFDALPHAERWLVVETSHREEFAPLKNMEGADSPDTVKAALSARAKDWLQQAGIDVPRRDDWPQEISPLLALDVDELAARVQPDQFITGPRYWTI